MPMSDCWCRKIWLRECFRLGMSTYTRTAKLYDILKVKVKKKKRLGKVSVLRKEKHHLQYCYTFSLSLYCPYLLPAFPFKTADKITS